MVRPHLDVTTSDLSEGSNIKHRCLASDGLELERATARAVDSKASGVAEQKA